MRNTINQIPERIRSWLLESSDPSLKYRVLTELLDVPFTQREKKEYEIEISNSDSVRSILSRMHPDGYWLQLDPNTKNYVGDGVSYQNFATTHYCLSYLSELGMTRKNSQILKAAERYLNLQSSDGDWHRHFSCYYAYNLKTYIKLGYRNDKRIKRTIELLLASIRFDNGYLCDIHEKPIKKVKSCIRGSTKALEAFAELGEEYWEHSTCNNLINYFLERNGIFKTQNHNEYANRDVNKLIYPFQWKSGLLQILYCLSKMGFGKDNRLSNAWHLLESKMDNLGRFPLEWAPNPSPWKIGKRWDANKWITFYAYLAFKYRR